MSSGVPLTRRTVFGLPADGADGMAWHSARDLLASSKLVAYAISELPDGPTDPDGKRYQTRTMSSGG